MTVYSVAALATFPMESDTVYKVATGSLFRYVTGGELRTLIAPVVIPTGSLLTFLELDACDTNALHNAAAVLYRCSFNGCSQMALVSTGVPQTPGCSEFVTTAISDPVMNNENFHYLVQIGLGALDPTTSLAGIRIGWTRQVSPSPAFATFADVPTSHPFHRFVEALAASGITSGCGGGNYCPDSPLTRGQMAVFLSAALGLHWPN